VRVTLLLLGRLWSVQPLLDIQDLFGPRWEWFFHAVSLLGDSRLIFILVVALFWFVARRRPYEIIAATLIGSAIGSILKLTVDFPRPADPNLILHAIATSPSFPSGHVILATCFWGTLAWYRWIPHWGAALIVGLVATSRMYLGVHFVGDVVVGAAIGIVWLVLFHRFAVPHLRRIDTVVLSRAAAVVLCGSVLVLPVASAFPFGWEILGGLAGAGVALMLLESRVRFEPGPVGLPWQAAKLGIGLSGVATFIGLDLVLPREVIATDLILFFCAGVWALYVTPLILQRLGLGQQAAAS
jgi:membrane-associated phospholipid phosphatase